MRTRRSLLGLGPAVFGAWLLGRAGDARQAATPDAPCEERRGRLGVGGCPRPPRMLLRAASGASQRAALGTWCWSLGERGCCVDMMGIYPRCPASIVEGEALEIQFGQLGTVSEMHVEVRPDPNPEPGVEPAADPGSSRHVIVVEDPVSPFRLPADLAPGAWVIDVFAYADGPRGGGDTAQGFRFVVEEGQGGVGTPVAATPVAGATPVEGD